MRTDESFVIDLRDVVREAQSFDFGLDDNFFVRLEQDEILGGKVSVRVDVKYSAGDAFVFNVKGEGRVVTPCDRCLAPVEIPVTFDEEMILAYGEDLPFSQTRYDIAWNLYEFTVLALPLQRVHDEAECDEETLTYLNNE